MSQTTAPVSSHAQKQFFGHPRGLMTLFFTEMWERFTYYGMRALLVLFMTAAIADGGFGFSADKAGPIYAMYTSLVYLATVPGGWLADNFLGQRRSVLYGGVLIMLGNAMLVFHGATPFYCGLGMIVLGTGLLKPNISVIVGQLYTPEDKRRDAGFSIFYMGINLGAFAAPLVCGFLAQNPAWKHALEGMGMDPKTCWHWGFGAAAVGMFFGLVQYVLTGKYLGDAGLHPTPKDAATTARNKRTLTIGVVATAVVAIALVVFDGTARNYDAMSWQPKGEGLVVEVTAQGSAESKAQLEGGAALSGGALKAALGADTLGALKREVFKQRVAAGKAAGKNDDTFLRVGETTATEAPEVRIGKIKWTDVPGGVAVVGITVGDEREIALDVLKVDDLAKDPPERLKKAKDAVLGGVFADAVKAGATSGSLVGVDIKVGGLNGDNIHEGFTILLILITVGFFLKLFRGGDWTSSERARLRTIFVLFCGAAIFWGIFEQAGSTLTLFADRSTHNSIFGFGFPSSWWQSVNAVLIIFLAPFFAWLWLRLGKRDPSYPTKFGVGLLFAGLGFLLLVGGAMAAKGGVEVSPLWLFGVYLLHTIGELCLSPVGLSSMTKLAPQRVVSLMMGVWFLAASIGNFIGGSVAGFYEKFELPTLFGLVAASGVVMALLMFALVAPIKRMMERNA